ncbi:hypothetical protein LB518_11750 [Mesorhizobium sp. BR1-1-16]|uniref:hypothetical protein n=1 Tax=Mesorhizobium sp. BR1-1-16 TaxID=2876653 RepID=UPI001CCCFB41|nr:hypothetical protein [Mesorhizobium sp. BR1-1-16]MBZ9936971.1 hypothetical protein [Mesorhizobium sp. BR1-1-16]
MPKRFDVDSRSTFGFVDPAFHFGMVIEPVPDQILRAARSLQARLDERRAERLDAPKLMKGPEA